MTPPISVPHSDPRPPMTTVSNATRRRPGPMSGENVVIGGLGSLWGTLMGGVILGIAHTIGAKLDPAYRELTGHLVFLLVLLARRSEEHTSELQSHSELVCRLLLENKKILR